VGRNSPPVNLDCDYTVLHGKAIRHMISISALNAPILFVYRIMRKKYEKS
jgi:hypothetical protein